MTSRFAARACLTLVIAVGLLPSLAGPSPQAAGKAEILWDRYGVPHIFAQDRASMFYAEGWAQTQAQGNLLLKLYGESRGRARTFAGSHADVITERTGSAHLS